MINPPKYKYFEDLLWIRTGKENFRSGRGKTHIKTIETLSEWEEKRQCLRELYYLTLGEEPNDLFVPFEAKVEYERKYSSYILRKISYWLMKDERASSYMLIPKNIKEPLPAIICIPPTTPLGKEQTIGKDTTPEGYDRAYALHLVNEGFITFAIDWLSCGERKLPNADYFQTTPFYRMFPKWSVRGKDIFDIKRTIDLLSSFPEVDSERIGSIGHSQGGGITIEAMVAEERIKVGVSSCGYWPTRFSKNPFNHCRITTDYWVGRPLLKNFALTGKDFPIDLHELLAIIAPRPFMFITALNDFGFSLNEIQFTKTIMNKMTAEVRKIYELYNKVSNFATIIHTEGHSFKESQRKSAYDFLKKHLLT